MTTQQRYEAMTLAQLVDERDRLLVRVDRWLSEGYHGMAKLAAYKLDRVEMLMEAKGMPILDLTI